MGAQGFWCFGVAGVSETVDREQLSKLLKDQYWRLNHLYWIEDKDGKLVRFRMNYAQRRLWRELWYRVEILKARQLGMSTFVELLILDSSLFNRNWQSGIIDKTLPDAQKKLKKIRLAYEMLDYLPPNPTAEDRALAAIGAELKADKKLKLTKQKETSLKWSNGSEVSVGVTMRGGTLQLLHVSEMASIAAHFPKRAKEIKTGALEAVATGNYIIKESTHEGGRIGHNYEMVARAMANVGRNLSPQDYRFFFFSWFENPEYCMDAAYWEQPGRLSVDAQRHRDRMTEYFEHLRTLGVELSSGQKAWYSSKAETLGFAMRQEYPSNPNEAFETMAECAVYGDEMAGLQMQGRLVAEFEPNPMLATYVSYDLGHSDLTSMWLFQVRPDGQVMVLDHYANRRYTTDHYVGQARRWEAKYRVQIIKHFLPHDSRQEGWEGNSFESLMSQAGFTVCVVPRTPRLSMGLDSVRRLLPRCIFHERCSEKITASDGKELPSGVQALSNYQWAPEGNNGVSRDEPLHDIFSHSADGFRYFAEAWDAGFVGKQGRWVEEPEYGGYRTQQRGRGTEWL